MPAIPSLKRAWRWTASYSYHLLLAAPVVILVGVLVLWPESWGRRSDALRTGRDAVACLGVATIILGGYRWLRAEQMRTTRLALDMMLDFYKDERLETVRAALRRGTPLDRFQYWESGRLRASLLRYDVVRVMNYFEAVAIGVDRGALDPDIVHRILGTPMCEVLQHPQMKVLLKGQYSYERFVSLLADHVLPRKEREHLRVGDQRRACHYRSLRDELAWLHTPWVHEEVDEGELKAALLCAIAKEGEGTGDAGAQRCRLVETLAKWFGLSEERKSAQRCRLAETLAERFRLSEERKSARLPSGRDTLWDYHIGRAAQGLIDRGYLAKSMHGVWRVTEQ